jgi:hypothetical protein
MFRFVSAKAVRYALVPLVSFWIAGTACLLGCSMGIETAHAASTPSDQNVVVAHETCASSKSHDCCAEKQETEQEASPKSLTSRALIPQGGPSGQMGECPMAISATAVISKVGQEQAPVVKPMASIPAVVPVVLEYTSPTIEPPRVPNRGHTYLRCCVFLI